MVRSEKVVIFFDFLTGMIRPAGEGFVSGDVFPVGGVSVSSTGEYVLVGDGDCSGKLSSGEFLVPGEAISEVIEGEYVLVGDGDCSGELSSGESLIPGGAISVSSGIEGRAASTSLGVEGGVPAAGGVTFSPSTPPPGRSSPQPPSPPGCVPSSARGGVIAVFWGMGLFGPLRGVRDVFLCYFFFSPPWPSTYTFHLYTIHHAP